MMNEKACILERNRLFASGIVRLSSMLRRMTEAYELTAILVTSVKTIKGRRTK